LQSVADILRRVPIFAGLSDEQLASVERGTEMRLRKGNYIKRAGDPPDGFYIVLEGRIEWTSKVRGQDVYVQSLTAGEFWGHELLLTGKLYPVSGLAVTDVRLYALKTDDFWLMLSDCPSILRNLVAIVVERFGNLGEVEQQHARLISLGSMAAGLAHELNNPAAAAGRSANEAREMFRESSARAIKLGALDMSPEERLFVAGLPAEAAARAETARELDSLERSDLEDEVALWLEDRGVEEAWDLSPTLVGAGLDAGWLDELEGRLPDGHAGDVVAWLASEVAGDELLREIGHASNRISELVGAVKSYSYMDKTTSREVDVHAGLNSALIMLGHKLKKGAVEVVRDFAKDLPHVCGHGGELNQVWTNLIDNAIDAVDGHGRITVRTASEDGRVLVEIADDGPGIPEDVRDRIFEPFYTTKDVGKGTGLGLDISHRVVVEDHKGDIRVLSEPGDTRFQVRLPVDGPKDAESGVGRDLRMESGA
jgi:signal transduction histidine kinase